MTDDKNTDDDLPGNWTAGIGERNGDTYTRPFYNDEKNLELRVYYDEHGDDKHHVTIRDTDSGYPDASYKADTESDAMEQAHIAMENSAGDA